MTRKTTDDEEQSASPKEDEQSSKSESDRTHGEGAANEHSGTSGKSNTANTSQQKPEADETHESKSKTSSKEKKAPSKSEPWVSEETLSSIFDRISDVTSSAFRFAKKTTDTSYKVGKAIIQSQDQLKLMVSAGQSLKDLREVAGLTVSELSDAVNLKDKSLLEAVENGTATLSFELILRLSALLARNDPIPFILKFSRTYSPETWKLLNDWGAGRLPLQYQREREFINIYRSKDQARQLSDEGYNQVLEFTRHAFNLSLHFIAEQEAAISAVREEAKDELERERQQSTNTDEMVDSGSPNTGNEQEQNKDEA